MAKIKKKITSVGAYSIDSLKLHIPLSLCKIIDKNLHRNIGTYDIDTGEDLDDVFKSTSAWYEVEGAKLKIAKHGENLILMFSSKWLFKDYFSGITVNNIHKVYDEIMKLKAVQFEFDAFMSSTITDFDIKLDNYMSNDIVSLNSYDDYQAKENVLNDFDELTKYLKEKTRLFNRLNPGVIRKASRNNKGVQWSKREGNYNSYKEPFLKLYHKGLELASTSSGFANLHLKEYDYKKIIRLETTVKDAKHLKGLLKDEFDTNTLDSVLRLSQAQYKHIMSFAINQHIGTIKRSYKTPGTLKPIDLMTYKFILALMESKMSFVQIVDMQLDGITSKKTRYRTRQKMNDIYRNYIEKTDLNISLNNRDILLQKFGFLN